MPTLQTRRCRCDEEYDVLTHNGVSMLMADVEDDERLRCPSCGSDDHRVIIKRDSHGHRNRASEDTMYPYYNKGLGCWLTSDEHKRRVMKEKGVVEAPGLDLAAQARDEGRLAEENAHEYNAIVEEMEGSGEYADWRRQRDLEALGR